MDSPLFTIESKSALSDLGSATYQQFDRAVVLERVMRQAGEDPEQRLFRDMLMRLRNGELSREDWKHLMTRTPAEVRDVSRFDDALHLFPTTKSVAEHNVAKLRANGQPTALIKAVHSGPGAAKATTDEAGGLEPAICIAHDACSGDAHSQLVGARGIGERCSRDGQGHLLSEW